MVNTSTSVGADPFTMNNNLAQDIIQINDNFNIYLPNHVVSIGTANEFFKFTNVFNPMINGNYQYNSISDFLNNVSAPTATNAPYVFQVHIAAVAGKPGTGCRLERPAIWRLRSGFLYTGFRMVKLTYGIQVDLPSYPTTLPQNPVSDALTFANGEKVIVGQLPKTNPLYSPRIGFNWDVKGDKTLQVRGGTGVFTGRIPFVWLSNQVTNNGLLFGQITQGTQVTGAQLVAAQAANFASGYNFNPNPFVPATIAITPQISLNSTVSNFKFPQVWRTNTIAVDKALPYGMIANIGSYLY